MTERENYLILVVREEEAEVVPPHRLHGGIASPPILPGSAPLDLVVRAAMVDVLRPVASSVARW